MLQLMLRLWQLGTPAVEAVAEATAAVAVHLLLLRLPTTQPLPRFKDVFA